MVASVTALLQDLVRTPAIEQFTATRKGVQRSELMRVATRLFRLAWQDTGRSRLDNTAPIPTAIRPDVEAVLCDIKPQLVEIASVTSAVLGRVAGLAAQNGRMVRSDFVSGLATSATSSHLIKGGAIDDEILIGLAQQVLAKVDRSPSLLDSSAFAESVGDFYDDCWHRTGAKNLAQHPPSKILLGDAVRPPLTHTGSAPDNDLSGTNRCIFHRYRGLKGLSEAGSNGPVVKVPYRSAAARCRQETTLREPGRNLAWEEVEKACQPYGLTRVSHHGVLRAIHNSTPLPDDTDAAAVATARAAFRSFSQTCRTMTDPEDEELVALALTGLISYELRRQHERRNRLSGDHPGHGPDHLKIIDESVNARTIAEHPEKVTLVLVRRAWLALHSLELHLEEPICSCSLVGMLRTALQRAVPDVLHHRRVLPEVALNRYDSTSMNPPASQQLEQAHTFVERLNATSSMLMRVPDAADVMRLRPGWLVRYDQLTSTRPSHYLSAAQFRTWCLDVVPGARTDTDAPDTDAADTVVGEE